MADGKDESLKESWPGLGTRDGRCGSCGILDARNIYSGCVDREADYIDMEVGSAPVWEAAAAVSMMNSKLNNTIVRAESREFEFDMSGINVEAFEDRDAAIASPADELFYKGQLLPLHLPPRLQMVEKLLASELKSRSPQSKTLVYVKAGNNSDLIAADHVDRYDVDDNYEDFLFFEDACADSITLTPYASCDVSPYNSCDATQELRPDLYNNNNDINVRNIDQDRKINKCNTRAGSGKRKPRLPILRRVKEFLASAQFKQSALAMKLRASKAYLKSMFTGSASSCGNKKKSRNSSNNNNGDRCIDHRGHNKHSIDPEEINMENLDIHPENLNIASKTQGLSNSCRKAIKLASASSMRKPKEHGAESIQIQSRSSSAAAASVKSSTNTTEDVNFNSRRKSFSGSLSLVKLSSQYAHNQVKSAMNSSSKRSSPGHSGRILQRSSSDNFDTENAIQGAIAHCKQSHASRNFESSASDGAGGSADGCADMPG